MRFYEPHLSRCRVTLFTGNYGSGKTEVALNFSLSAAARETGVRVADLDIVNPYFRSRDVTEFMEERGVQVIAPEGALRHADLPVILPEVRGLIEDHGTRAVIDVGGDPVGARVLGAFHGCFDETEMDLVVVLNGNRPFTDTPEGCVGMIREIEGASRLRATALAGNTHLMESTTVETVMRGEDLVLEVSSLTGLPVRFETAARHIIAAWSGPEPRLPVLPLERHMLPPWIQRGAGRTMLDRAGI